MAMRLERLKQSADSTGLRRCESGASAVEFALVAPILVFLLMGIVAYGGWFWLSVSVQSLATEGARAAIAGLDAAESRELAEKFVEQNAAAGSVLDMDQLRTRVESDEETIRVTVLYDASKHPLILLAGPLPKPPGVIERVGIVRVGGFS